MTFVMNRRKFLRFLADASQAAALFGVTGISKIARSKSISGQKLLGKHGATVSTSTAATADPWSFGARFDGVSDDTRAWQSAIDHAASLAIPIVVSKPGTSVIVCSPEPRGTYGNQPQMAVFQALDINHSNLSIDLGGSRISVKGAGVQNCANYAFGTAKNRELGSISNFAVRNGIIDFDPTGDPSITKRSFYLIGIDGVCIEHLLLTSSGHRAGATITLQNCKNVCIRNVSGLNVTQGMNLSYVDSVLLENLIFDNFSEAIDCDRRVTNLTARNLTFRNGGPRNQCMDLNSVENVTISDVNAYNVGNIFLINYKLTTPRTFAEYIDRAPVKQFSPSKNVRVERVRGDRICFPTSTSVPILVGDNQRIIEQNAYPLENIFLDDIVLTNCPSSIRFEQVKNAVFQNARIEGAVNPSDSIGCIDIRGKFVGTQTSVTLRNIELKLGPGATRGVRANSPAHLELRNVTVSGQGGDDLVFFDFTTLERNSTVLSLQGVKAVAYSGHGGVAFRFGGADRPDYSIEWKSGNSASGKFDRALVLNGGAHMHWKVMH